MTTEDFVEKYEKPYKPVIIRGVQNGWRAQHKWTIEVCYLITTLIYTIGYVNISSVFISKIYIFDNMQLDLILFVLCNYRSKDVFFIINGYKSIGYH